MYFGTAGVLQSICLGFSGKGRKASNKVPMNLNQELHCEIDKFTLYKYSALTKESGDAVLHC